MSYSALASGGAAIAVTLLLAAAGCESSRADEPDATACSDCADVPGATAADVPSGGTAASRDLKAQSNYNVALSASMTFTTDVPSYGAMVVEADGVLPFVVESDASEPATSHEAWVVGLKPSTTYRLRARTRLPGSDGVLDSDPIPHTTPDLPLELPTIDVPVSDSARAAPGVTMFVLTVESTSGSGTGPPDPRTGIYAVDASGRIVSVVRALKFGPGTVMGFNILDDGHLALTGYFGLVELDLFGRVVQERSAADLGIDILHHDLVRSPDGGWFGLTTELRQLTNTKGKPVNIVVDVACEIDASGAVTRKWYVEDHVPIPVDATIGQGFWDKLYPQAVPNYTAYTANSITYDATDDTVVVSLFQQGILLKLRRATGDLVWKMGVTGTVTMAEGGTWFAGSHGPTILPDGSLLIFDNGNGKLARAVEYALTKTPEGTYRATQTWQYVQDFYSPFGGNVERFANGNTFLCNATRLVTEPVAGTSPSVVEVTGGPNPEKVFEMRVAPMGQPVPGPQFFMYRAKKVYDRHFWVETPAP